MKLELREVRHCAISFDQPSKDPREVLIDTGYSYPDETTQGDVRITDHRSVVKVRFDRNLKIKDVLVNDVFVWQAEAGGR